MWSISLTVPVVIKVTLERQKGTFAQEQKNMLVLTKTVPFLIILELDSFDTANKIRLIPPEVFYERYVLVSFDVESLFTNLPLKRTIDFNLDRVYNKKMIFTQLKKRTLKKLIKDTCTKEIFSANKKLYQQIDGISMGSSRGSLLANIIMTELERTIIKKFINDKILLFYGHYVDDTLVLFKKEHLQLVNNTLNSFDEKLTDLFDNYDHLKGLFSFENDSFNEIQCDTTEVQNNTEIIDSTHNWEVLLLK